MKEEVKTEVMPFRMTNAFKERLFQAAESEGKTASEYIRSLCEKDFKKKRKV